MRTVILLVTSEVRKLTPVLAPLLLIALVVLGASFLPSASQRQATEMLIYTVLVVGLYLFVGNTGVLSFGHMGFAAIGGYVGALVTIPVIRKEMLLPNLLPFLQTVEVSPLLGAFIAGFAAVVFALIIAAPITRISGLAASLSLFAILVVIYQVALKWNDVTRGSQTMLGIPTKTTLISAALWSGTAVVVAYVYQRSAMGLRARATRDDGFAARAAGISISRERAIALLLSAFLMGVGGFLYAQFQGALNPSTFYINMTFITIAMLIFGGQNSLAGAVIGTFIISLATFMLDRVEGGFQIASWEFAGRDGLGDGALAALILFVLIFRRNGIMNGREIYWPTQSLTRKGH